MNKYKATRLESEESKLASNFTKERRIFEY